MKRTILIFACLIFFFPVNNGAQTVTDYDGNVYDTIMIGGKAWLKQNLKTTHYRNGVAIPHVAGGTAWASLYSGARCYYDNDSTAYDPVYGALYNWYAVINTNGLCPDGWHVPTDGEWADAENFLGGSAIAGGKMKEEGTLHWLPPNVGATNSSRFTGLPGGMLGTGYTFQTLNENGLWWTSTATTGAAAYSRYFWYLNTGVDCNPTPKTAALSIRCIKNTVVGTGDAVQPRIRIFPNPAKDIITITIPGNQAVKLIIYNSSGMAVMQKEISGVSNRLDIGKLAAGIYVVELTGGFATLREKLVME